jgi:hypothetical protein
LRGCHDAFAAHSCAPALLGVLRRQRQRGGLVSIAALPVVGDALWSPARRDVSTAALSAGAAHAARWADDAGSDQAAVSGLLRRYGSRRQGLRAHRLRLVVLQDGQKPQ